MRFRFSWFGVGLVVVGAALFFHRLWYIPFGWLLVFWGIVAVAGAFKIYRGFLDKHGSSAFWGTILLLLGLFNVLDAVDLFTLDHPYVGTAIFLSLGIAFLLRYLVHPKAWHMMVPSIIFLALGGVMLLANLGYLYRWDVEDFIRTYWPAALIIFGGSLLLSRASTQ